MSTHSFEMFSGCAIRVTGHDTVAHQNFTVIGVSATLADTLYTLATANLATDTAPPTRPPRLS